MITSFSRKLFGGSAKSAESRLRNTALIACDLDGTLLNGDEMVGAAPARMIKAIESLGVRFILITRRHHQSAEPYAELLNMTVPIISLDGSMICLPSILDPSYLIEFDQEFARDILDETRAVTGADFCAITPEHFFISDEAMPLPSQHLHWNIDTRPVSRIEEVSGKILEIVVSGTLHGANAVLAYVESKMRKDELKLRLYESRSLPGTWFLEMRPTSANKRTALEHLVAQYGISMKEVVGIGDYRNDIEFCRKSGYVVAMQNAVSELKEIADFITQQSCLEDGIAEFLEYFLRVRGVDTAEFASEDDGQYHRRRSR